MKKILVTGGAGFIGSNFIPHFLNGNQDVWIVNLDKLTYAGNLANLREVEQHQRYTFIQGDITDRPLLDRLFSEHKFQGVIHFAAESHVDNSVTGPLAFVQTNVVGTFHLLDAARLCWMSAPHQVRPEFAQARFLHVSTDEVYGSLGKTGLFSEVSPYAPNSPYSATKASSDHLVRSYVHTYGLRAVTTNCSNNFGPKQHAEKLIPTVIRNALAGKPIPIYGQGTNVRDWLYVEEHCVALELVFFKGRAGESYNIGSRNELRNIDLCRMICEILDRLVPRTNGTSYADQITFVTDRPGHDQRYAIDPTKIERELGWRARTDFSANLEATIRHYLP